MAIFGLFSPNGIAEGFHEKMAIPYGGMKKVEVTFADKFFLGCLKKDPNQTHSQSSFRIDGADYFIVFSGYILNRKEISSYVGIKDADCDQLSDARLFLLLLLHKRASGLKKINGIYCAAVIAPERERIELFSDRIGGFNTLYYTIVGGRFFFSTALQSLTALSLVSREIDTASLYDFFSTGYLLPPYTLLKNVYKSAPGEKIRYSQGEVSTEIFDRIDPFVRKRSMHECTAEAMQAHLENSISRIISRTLNRGYMLSGGIDSSSIVTVASHLDDKPLNTFTASFPGTQFDESPLAKIVEEANGCKGVTVNLSDKRLLNELPEIVWHLAEPTLDFSILPSYHLLKKVAATQSTIVCGDGPDHLFCRYYPLAAKRFLLRPFRSFFNKLHGITHHTLISKLRDFSHNDWLTVYNTLFTYEAWGTNNIQRLTPSPFSTTFKEQREQPYLKKLTDIPAKNFTDIFNKLQYIDFYIDGSFGVFNKIGKASSAFNLLAAEPFFDRELIDFIMETPQECKVNGNFIDILRFKAKNKYMLKDLLGKKILPKKITEKTKGGFTPPLQQWIIDRIERTPLDKLFCQDVLSNGLLNREFIEKLIHEQKNGITDRSRLLYMLLSFDLWYRMFILNDGASPPEWNLNDIYS